MYRNMTLTTALVMVLLGVAMIVRTLADGGLGVGVLLGALFIAAGVGRYWMLRGSAR